ncbi:NAD(P)H-dependent oxidoreductase [Jatrophihabitans telluris]|uniref:NAD(P)H-dependent oxidoreductase n=1 Tax=Jatrophihabitans telluris TaxID=2038343 RepID=A0ABY4QVA8_9ACTN|nr:NAD(P)H-dependent oxidoreductase [Jatrophihabitans telluris]UQX87415.1 NAD(P)H-dependent oxidoreductase [Jatrophihabitans telluris]
MPHKVLGLNAGSPGGNTEIVLVQALRAAAAEGADVELVRLDDLHLPLGPGPKEPDDAWWFWERLMEADGFIVSAPIFSRVVPARLKLLMDRLLGPNADRAIVEKLIAMRASGEEPAVPFRVDERVLKPRVGGFIAVGGALTPQWKTLALPTMHILTFSMQTAVVDQFVVSGAGTPKSVVLDEDAMGRSARLGRNVARQLGRSFDEADYVGEPGLCPMCHLSVIELHGRSVDCATCGAQGRLADDFTIDWTDLDCSVISMAEKSAHYDEILQTAQRHAKVRDTITERAADYDGADLIVRPEHA